ncbi:MULTISPECIES: hypothetical protein [unclassified Pseudofrankia]|uniref:hypothetical protein n=1 Tax=unclassified Pseudofrankia TaxID=2994372 RepID=UPI0008DB0D65|nr:MULTISPECIES: hypothetical protein [unclassified Pseudofrankia]MDT3442558.1 hypothetical protein [Pseudofrankia sp. BMG5.37]OHV71784.1 hypothetical protein BCD48_34365 [Pseudofrankia sp. BMG5.36]
MNEEAAAHGELVDDVRLGVPLFTTADVARQVLLDHTVLVHHARRLRRAHRAGGRVGHGPVRPGLVTTLPVQLPADPSVPFVGLVEALVLAAFCQAPMPRQQIEFTLLVLRGGAPVAAVLSRYRAGESVADLAHDFDVPAAEISDAAVVDAHRAS